MLKLTGTLELFKTDFGFKAVLPSFNEGKVTGKSYVDVANDKELAKAFDKNVSSVTIECEAYLNSVHVENDVCNFDKLSIKLINFTVKSKFVKGGK